MQMMLGKEHSYIYIYMLLGHGHPQLKRQSLDMDSDWHVETKKIISRVKNRMCTSLGYENECDIGGLHCKFHKELQTRKSIYRDYMLKNNNVSSEGLNIITNISDYVSLHLQNCCYSIYILSL